MDEEEIEKIDYENYYPKGIEKLLKANLTNQLVYEKYEKFNHTNILTIEKTISNYFILLKNGSLLSILDKKAQTLGRTIRKDSQIDQTIGKVQIPERIVDVRCGERHALALTICGKIYAWGENIFGQLGFSNSNENVDDEPPCDLPKRIKFFDLLDDPQELNIKPTIVPIDLKTFRNLLIIPRKHGKSQIFLANVNLKEKSLSSALEVAKSTTRPKSNLNIQPQSKSKLQEVNSRVDEVESKIINFVNFIKKDFVEKEKQQNLLDNYKAILNNFKDENKEESNIKKKTFEDKFSEISQITTKLKAEFDFKENFNQDNNLNLLVKSAKDDLRSAYNNKSEKAEAQEKCKFAVENLKKLEAKTRSFKEILEKTIGILEVDKKTLLEEELNILISKIEEEIPILELKYLKSLGEEVKILCETRSRAQKANGNPFVCSLRKLLQQTVLFVDEIKKKVFDLKNSQMHSSLKYALEKLNDEISETNSKLKLENISFLNFKKSDDVINAFNLFILTLKQNAILLTKILNLSELFYSKTLGIVFDRKLAKVANRSKSSNADYNEKFKDEKRKNFMRNLSLRIKEKNEISKDYETPGVESELKSKGASGIIKSSKNQ